MIVRQSEVHHRPDLDLAIDGNGPLLDSMETKHGALGQVDDGSAVQGTEDAAVADGECTTRHILDGELAVTSL